MSVTTTTQLHPLQIFVSEDTKHAPHNTRPSRSQTALRVSIDGASPPEDLQISRHQPPFVGTLPKPYVEIPAIRRFSATPEINHQGTYSGSTTPVTAQQFIEETQSTRHKHMRSKHHHNLHIPSHFRSVVSPLGITPVPTPVLTPGHQTPDDYFTPVQPAPDCHTINEIPEVSRQERPVRNPGPMHGEKPIDKEQCAKSSASKPRRKKPKSQGLSAVYAATKVKDEKDDTIPDGHDLKQERPNAGPIFNQCPVLQEIFAKLEASDEEWSSDSDMERYKKRKSIAMNAEGLDKKIITDRFGRKGTHENPAN